MVDVATVVILVTSLVVAFSGAFLGLAASSVKKPVAELARRMEQHQDRIAALERCDAVREAQYRNMMEALEDIKEILEHNRRANGG